MKKLAKNRKFKDVHGVYYLPKEGVCDIFMQGTKPTSRPRYAKNIKCKGITAEAASLSMSDDHHSHFLFDKPVICEYNDKWKKIFCPP